MPSLRVLRIVMEDMQEKGVDIGLFFQQLCDGLPQAMTSFGVNTQQNWLVPGVCRLQSGGEFESMRRDDAVVAIPGGDQRRRICGPTRHMVERRIGIEKPKMLGVRLGIAIFWNPKAAGGKAVIAQHIGHRHTAHHGAEEVWTLQQAGSHQ